MRDGCDRFDGRGEMERKGKKGREELGETLSRDSNLEGGVFSKIGSKHFWKCVLSRIRNIGIAGHKKMNLYKSSVNSFDLNRRTKSRTIFRGKILERVSCAVQRI